jgi:hypothetical protein
VITTTSHEDGLGLEIRKEVGDYQTKTQAPTPHSKSLICIKFKLPGPGLIIIMQVIIYPSEIYY